MEGFYVLHLLSYKTQVYLLFLQLVSKHGIWFGVAYKQIYISGLQIGSHAQAFAFGVVGGDGDAVGGGVGGGAEVYDGTKQHIQLHVYGHDLVKFWK